MKKVYHVLFNGQDEDAVSDPVSLPNSADAVEVVLTAAGSADFSAIVQAEGALGWVTVHTEAFEAAGTKVVRLGDTSFKGLRVELDAWVAGTLDGSVQFKES